jgi:transcription elongation factor Elf1
MHSHKISCPRCGGRSIATKNAPEGSHEIQPGADPHYCRNCGQSLETSIRSTRSIPRLGITALAAIVLTLVKSTN